MSVSDGDIGAHFARGAEESERQRIRRHNGQRAGVVRRLDGRLPIDDGAVRCRVLQEYAKDFVVKGKAGPIGDDDPDA